MRKPHIRTFVLVTVFFAGVIAGHAIPARGHAAQGKVTNLLVHALSEAFTPDREVIVDAVEIPPGGALDWHWHPGEEFHYYVEGNPVIEISGSASIEGKPGTVGHVPFKQRHRATAGDLGAKIIVFRVHTKGEPWRYLDSASPSPKSQSR